MTELSISHFSLAPILRYLRVLISILYIPKQKTLFKKIKVGKWWQYIDCISYKIQVLQSKEINS